MAHYLLAEGGSSLPPWVLPVVLGVLLVGLVVWFIFSGRKNKARQKEYIEQLDAIKPGNKVKTIGGICGVVVEVCDDNTVIIESGTEKSGKSYVKMDKECIAQTDAKGPSQLAREQAEAAKKAEKEAGAPVAPAAPAQPEDAPKDKSEEAPVEASEKVEEAQAKPKKPKEK